MKRFHSAGRVLCTVNYVSVIRPRKPMEFRTMCDREIKRGLLMKKRYCKPVINCVIVYSGLKVPNNVPAAGAKLRDFHS